ncbi:MAG: glycosyltransferase family 4 protein [Pseudohongiella sp.]|nr:glycosyltransferase family 4 protein [Pseudohongiella sp.]
MATNNSSSKHIILCSNTAWYLFNFHRYTISALIDQGHRVTCIASYDRHADKLENLGAKFVVLAIHGANTRMLGELSTFIDVMRCFIKLRPDMVLNFTIKMNVYAGLFARMLRIPYINNISGLGTAFIHNSAFYRLIRRLYGVANAGSYTVFFQNPDDLEEFVLNGLVSFDRARLLPGSGLNVSQFKPSPPPDAPFTFLMIARLIADKGVREFVNAAKIVRARYPSTRFILVGPGEVENKSAISRQEIGQWEQESIVEMPGAVSDVRPWLKECHVFVLPSYREGMPRAVLEAAAMGRPAIVADVPGCRQSIVAGQTGWLCKVRDAESLAEQMVAVMQPEVDIAAYGARAAERVKREFSNDIVIRAYLDCVKALA